MLKEDAIKSITAHAYTATAIVGLCTVMSAALHADPDTSHIGDALEGLATLAEGISSDLLTICEDAEQPA